MATYFRAVCVVAFVIVCITVQAQHPRSPFRLGVAAVETNGAKVVRFQFSVPADHVIYAERLRLEDGQGNQSGRLQLPAPVAAVDKVTGKKKLVYPGDFAAELSLTSALPTTVVVKFQGCSNSACYFPERHTFVIGADLQVREQPAAETGTIPTSADGPASSAGWSAEADHFVVRARTTGYLKADDLLTFLQNATRTDGAATQPADRLEGAGLGLMLLLILLGGAGLNLTPCVLPLIPINLAIIGAGRAARSRADGFRQGAAYGAGMALTYGVLGSFVVLSGAKFGALNSSPWFNAVIAGVFVVLAVAMFGKLNLDFGRLGGGVGERVRGFKSRRLLAFGFGGMAALLAGACVAPVVISVLLLAANLYGQGLLLGLSLPFVLGLGMALPWPFAGASLSLLPKPGKWMNWVKSGFGAVILLFALYYGQLAWRLFAPRFSTSSLVAAPGAADAMPDSNAAFAEALARARREGKPVFVDFQASWCKNCEAMELTVFNQSAVQERLKDFVVVKYQAERPNESPAREVLDRFGALGLPTYVVLCGRPEADVNSVSSPNTNKHKVIYYENTRTHPAVVAGGHHPDHAPCPCCIASRAGRVVVLGHRAENWRGTRGAAGFL